MSEKAPERIWAYRWTGKQNEGAWTSYPRYATDEYTLTSLVATQIAQAREEARRESAQHLLNEADKITDKYGAVLLRTHAAALIAKDTK